MELGELRLRGGEVPALDRRLDDLAERLRDGRISDLPHSALPPGEQVPGLDREHGVVDVFDHLPISL